LGLLGVARANTAVGVSPETFLLLLLQLARAKQSRGNTNTQGRIVYNPKE
jgi:hypothetical protein